MNSTVQFGNDKNSCETQWKSIYRLGGITTVLVLIGIVLDIIIGSALGGDLSALPKTSEEWFSLFQSNWLLGFYNLDLLNMINQILLIPAYFALYAAHRHSNKAYAQLALIIFLTGTIIFITNNAALSMFDLSNKYYAAVEESQKIALVSAGEALLARGLHGSLGVFVGFVMPNIAGLIISFVMLSGKIFNKTTAYIGIFGNSLILIYFVLVTFIPEMKKMATAIAMPGGLLLLLWIILFTYRLLQLGSYRNN